MSPVEKLLSRGIRLESGCLVLPNHAENPKVYPSVNVNGKTFRANRLVFEHFNGPTDLLVLHTCDYPRCFEPSHLFAGTQSDNMKDMTSKGRHDYPEGETAYNWAGGVTYDMKEYHRNWKKNNPKREEYLAKHRERERLRRQNALNGRTKVETL